MSELQITREPIKNRQAKLTIVVPGSRVEAAMTTIAQDYGRRLKIRGYRPGHIPLRLVLAHVDEAQLRAEAIERVTRQATAEALRLEKLEPAAPVSVRRVSDDPLTIEATIPLPPEVDLGDYRSLRVPRPPVEPVTEEEVDEVIETWRKDMAFKGPVDRPAVAGDFVQLALTGKRDSETVFEAEDLELALTPEGATAAGLPTAITEALVGVQTGEERSFRLRYPEYWSRTDLQGQEVAFEAHITAVSAMTVPELDDDLAREVAGVNSLAELRERVRNQLTQRNELDSRNRYLESVLDALVASARVEYPPELLAKEVSEIIADLRERVERQGFSWERWLELSRKDEDALWEEIEPQARRRLERALVLHAFAAAEGIRVSREEIEAEARRVEDEVFRETGKRISLSGHARQDVAVRMHTGRTLERLIAIAEGSAPEGADHPDRQEES